MLGTSALARLVGILASYWYGSICTIAEFCPALGVVPFRSTVACIWYVIF